MRDNELIRSLKAMGNDVYMVPMYLPLNVGGRGLIGDTPVFYGAINIYLKEKLPFYRHAPMWLERIFDSESLLQFAAKRSGSTRASGLEDMTLSMLEGEKGHQSTELDHLIKYLQKEINPDVVHLSNALLVGLARRLKQDLGAAVVCSLQDENEWIDPMSQSYQDLVWSKMAERARDVDAFIAASRYYAELAEKQLNISAQKVHVVYGGIDLSNYEPAALTLDPPVIGYLCRLSDYFGLAIISDAFISLKQDAQFRDLKLYLMGGYTGDDRHDVDKLKKNMLQHGILKDVTIFDNFDLEHRIEFLKSLSLLSVPVPSGEAFGAYQVEALAAGVPIVQPNVGGYPEFIEATGGGMLYEPNDGEHLAQALAKLLLDPESLRSLGRTGREVVLREYTMKNMAENILKVYQDILNNN
jgi:glycosyltransferase involved in cell wall biosynthesis